MSATITLTGRLVRLEPLTAAHAQGLVAAATEPGARYTFTSVPADPDSAASYVGTAFREQADGRTVPFAIVDLRSGRVVGCTRFLDLAYWPGDAHRDEMRPGTPSAAEIGGTWLAASAQRTGANTEAKLLMLAHAFEVWRVHRVAFKTDVRNTQSRAAIERIGASFEGIRRAHMPAIDGTIRDTAYYSIVADEWPAIKHRLQHLLVGRSIHVLQPPDPPLDGPEGVTPTSSPIGSAKGRNRDLR